MKQFLLHWCAISARTRSRCYFSETLTCLTQTDRCREGEWRGQGISCWNSGWSFPGCKRTDLRGSFCFIGYSSLLIEEFGYWAIWKVPNRRPREYWQHHPRSTCAAISSGIKSRFPSFPSGLFFECHRDAIHGNCHKPKHAIGKKVGHKPKSAKIESIWYQMANWNVQTLLESCYWI